MSSITTRRISWVCDHRTGALLLCCIMVSNQQMHLCPLQLGAQALSEQVHAAASSSQQHQQPGSSKLDTAVRTLMQQESLQGKLYSRLPGLATVPAAQDEVAVNAVLKELCNMVSKPG